MNDRVSAASSQADLVFNPLDPTFIADPYPFYHRLRETAPVFKTPSGFWLVTRYDDAEFALRDKRFGKDFFGNMRRLYGNDDFMKEPVMQGLARTIYALDEPHHTRIRNLINKAFAARRIADMRPRIKVLVEHELDRVCDKGEMDVIEDLAHRLPAIVICDILGIPDEHREAFLGQHDTNNRLLDPVPLTREEFDKANKTVLQFFGYLDELIELRRRQPGDDLTTALVRAEEAGDMLTTEEVRANIGLMLNAGHAAITNLIGNGLLALHRQYAQWLRLKADPSLIPNAIEELLRYDPPSQVVNRLTLAEVEIRGITLPPGESISVLMGAANRDPSRFGDPDTLDIGRSNIRPLSFGGGIHYCLGAQLARMEGELVFSALIERLPGLRLPEISNPDWRPNFALRGLSRLPAVWH